MDNTERLFEAEKRWARVVVVCVAMLCATITICYVTSWMSVIIDHCRVSATDLPHIR